jgi:hypothetical protein
LLLLKKPLESGRDTEIDLIEREMEGGVLVIQYPSIHEDIIDRRLGGLVSIEGEVDVHETDATDWDWEAPTD